MRQQYMGRFQNETNNFSGVPHLKFPTGLPAVSLRCPFAGPRRILPLQGSIYLPGGLTRLLLIVPAPMVGAWGARSGKGAHVVDRSNTGNLK